MHLRKSGSNSELQIEVGETQTEFRVLAIAATAVHAGSSGSGEIIFKSS